MIMFLDYILYWVWCLFLYSLVNKVIQEKSIKETFVSNDLFGIGVVSLIMYMLVYRFSDTGGFVFL